MLLNIKNLNVHFRHAVAVKEANLGIEAGQCVALIGPSGCGKTTLARAILRLQPQATITGHIFFEDTDLMTLDERQMCKIRGGKIAMIFQEPMTALNPLHVVGKQVMESLILHDNNPVKQHVLDLFHMVDLKNPRRIFKSYPHELSGGERQRVLIAMALAGNPQLLIADEPTTALDAETQTQILMLLKRLQKELNLAILFITHDLAIVKQIANQVYMMDEGKVLADQNSALPVFSSSEPCNNENVVLDVRHLNVCYGNNHVVHDFNCTLHQGETLGLIGESGSGKSSIGFAIARLIDATGDVILNGRNFFKLKGKALKQARQEIQMVFQDPFSSLNPRWMVKDIIMEGARIHHIENVEDRLAQILQQVHLNSDIVHRYPHELSGGQRVRVALVRALILKPCVLILDEITTQLDVQTQIHILKLLQELQKTEHLSYLFITHDNRSLKALAHRVISISQGVSSVPLENF